jgi:pimeloyl-ACP methyl ester carboxylesterase
MLDHTEEIFGHLPHELRSFKGKFLDLNGKDYLHYRDEGHGEVILAIHGNPTWSYFYHSLFDQFKDRYRVIAPDHLGMGLSSRAPITDKMYLQNHVDHLVYLIDRLDLHNIHLVVHDWGGPIGLLALLKRQERFKSVTITNTSAFIIKDIPKRIHLGKIPILGPFLFHDLNLFSKAALKMAFSYKKPSPLEKLALSFPYQLKQNRKSIADFVIDIPQDSKHPSFQALNFLENNLKEIRVPKLVIWGGKDFCFHQDFYRKFQENFSDGKFHFFNDLGHYLFLEDAPRIMNLMEDFYHVECGPIH